MTKITLNAPPNDARSLSDKQVATMARLPHVLYGNYSWSGMNGNCGGRHVYRMSAVYKTREYGEFPANSMYPHEVVSRINSRLSSFKRYLTSDTNHPSEIIRALAGEGTLLPMPSNLLWAGMLNANIGTSVIVGFTDTDARTGDGHRGFFALRYFAKWLETMPWASISTFETVRYGGSTSERAVYGYYFSIPRRNLFDDYYRVLRQQWWEEDGKPLQAKCKAILAAPMPIPRNADPFAAAIGNLWDGTTTTGG